MRPFGIILKIAFAAFSALITYSCGNREAGRLMNSAEDVMWTRPDSALATLEAIDTLCLKTEAQRARYSLLFTMAQDRCGEAVSDLRIIRNAESFYLRHGSDEDKMILHYCLGSISFYAGDLQSAIDHLLQAKSLSDRSDNYIFRGLILSAISDVFACNNSYSQNIAYSEEALESFKMAGDSLHAWITTGALALYYAENKDWTISDSLYSLFFESPCYDSSIYARHLLNMAEICLKKPDSDPHLCVELFDKAVNNMNFCPDATDYCAYAYALDLLGHHRESDHVFSQLDMVYGDSAVFDVWKYRIHKLRNEYQTALSYLERTFIYQDSIVTETVNQSVALAQSDHFQAQSELLKKENQIKNRDIWIVMLFGIIAGLIILTLYSINKRKWQQQMDDVLSINENVNHRLSEAEETNDEYKRNLERLRGEISDERHKLSVMRLTNKEAEQKILSLTEQIDSLSKSEDALRCLRKEYLLTYKRQYTQIKDLCATYLETEGRRKEKELIYSKVKHLASVVYDCNQQKLEGMIDNNMDGLMTKLRKDLPTATDSDFRFIALWILGFEAKTVARVMNYSISSVYTKRTRLKERILATQSDNKELYLMLIG